MDADSQDEDSVDSKEDKSVDSYGLAVGLQAAEIQLSVVSR